ncbi:MAG: PSD1 and planctomycete cytochrome C domain-containing protein, partial [Pirellulales bacterium]
MNGQSKPNAHRSSACRRALVAVAAGGCLAGFALAWDVGCVRADDEGPRYFENNIRPILAERCSRCHGAKKQSSGLRLDSRQSMLAGGDSGPAIVPGDAAGSLILRAVRHEGELKMPPKQKLDERQIAALARWVESGAVWPKSSPPLTESIAERAKRHWAFQPIDEPEIPQPKDKGWVRTPVDAFVLAGLEEARLPRSPPVDRRTLVRRLSYTLTGLPPSTELIGTASDGQPDSYEQIVDHLLDTPHYGERWARHWLDVARYSDSKGYVYAREERFWVHAWTYRDWVVRALNDDLPYNRFVLLQLAADQAGDRREDDLAAMGFLTLGRRFLGVKRDIIDDRIEVVCRGTMGLTVGCARCHNHKYDPIPTADYYSLYGVFDSCGERLVPLPGPGGDEAWRKELSSRQQKLEAKAAASRTEWSNRVRQRVTDYLRAQTELHKYPARGFDQVFYKTDVLPAFVRRWEDYLHAAARRGDPVFAAWHAFAALQPESFAGRAAEVARRLRQADPATVNPIVARAFAEPPKSFADVVDRYGRVFTEIDAQWKSAIETAKADPPTRLAAEPAEQLRRVLYGPGAPCEVPDEPIVHTDSFYDSATCTEIWKLQGEVDRWIKDSSHARYALTLVDRPIVAEPRIFRRGNSVDKGADVPRQFLSLLKGADRKPFAHGSGRLELAREIIDPKNPLTARVIVNRVWMHHFGHGLVETPSDFGLRADPPSHPALLDWLAFRFMADGWSLKKLHRRIVLSATFRQSSTGPADAADRARAMKADPANRLLWRTNRRRLTFEEFRDSMLAAAGDLDRSIG